MTILKRELNSIPITSGVIIVFVKKKAKLIKCYKNTKIGVKTCCFSGRHLFPDLLIIIGYKEYKRQDPLLVQKVNIGVQPD